MDWRLRRVERELEAPPALVLRRLPQILAADREQVEGDEGGRRFPGELRHARRRRMQPQLERVEVESMIGGDDDLAVDHASLRQSVQQRVVQLGKVPIERPQIAALDVDVRFAAEHDRAEAVPLRLVQEIAGLGKRLGELREHRLDRRLDRKGHGCGGRCSRK